MLPPAKLRQHSTRITLSMQMASTSPATSSPATSCSKMASLLAPIARSIPRRGARAMPRIQAILVEATPIVSTVLPHTQLRCLMMVMSTCRLDGCMFFFFERPHLSSLSAILVSARLWYLRKSFALDLGASLQLLFTKIVFAMHKGTSVRSEITAIFRGCITHLDTLYTMKEYDNYIVNLVWQFQLGHFGQIKGNWHQGICQNIQVYL